MEKNKKMKQNRAITLVALVLTIIIMLILLGISVELIIDDKLIKQAENAVQKTNDIVMEEQNRVNKLYNEFE